MSIKLTEDELNEFRAEHFPRKMAQAQYKLIKTSDSPQNNGSFNDGRLESLKEETSIRTGKIRNSLLEKYNPNPGEDLSPEDYIIAKESLKNEPYYQTHRDHILSILNPTPTTTLYESLGVLKYESLASDNKPPCENKPGLVSKETWNAVTSVFDDICVPEEPEEPDCPEGQVKDCLGVCGGDTHFDCFGVCGGTARRNLDGNCCPPDKIGCSGKCLTESISFERKGKCCEVLYNECLLCKSSGSPDSELICPEHIAAGIPEDSSSGGGGGAPGFSEKPTTQCRSFYTPASNTFEKEQKAIKITFESVPELEGVYVPDKNIANSWILKSGGVNLARIQALKTFEGTCLIHWEFSFKTKNGELVDIDSETDEYDRKMLILSKNFSVSYSQKILEHFESVASLMVHSGLESSAAIDSLKDYFDVWPNQENFLDFSEENENAADSSSTAVQFVANTLIDAYTTEESKIRAELVNHDYNVPDDDENSEFCATNLSGEKVAFHWKAPLRYSQTGWRIVVKTTGSDINYTIGAEKCGYTLTRNDSWERIMLMRYYSNGSSSSTQHVKTLEVSDIGSCLDSTICPSSDTNSIDKKLSFQWSCNTVFDPSEVSTVSFSIDKDATEDYIDIKVLSSSTEYCNGADNIYFNNVKILDSSSNLEIDYSNQTEKYKYFKNDVQSSTFEVWLRIKHPTIKDGEFENFIEIIPETQTETQTHTESQTQTETQSSSLGNLKFYAMKEDLGHLETCPAGYFVLSLKKYNEDSFTQQGTNKIFTSGSGGSNMYDVPFLTLGHEDSEIQIDAGDTVKLRYRPMPPSGNPYLGTGCYSFYKKPNKVSLEYGEVEDTGSTTNPVITGWSKSGELDNSSDEGFTDFEYTFSESDGDKLNWCVVMKSTPITDFKVSGGSFATSPYYNFTAQHPYGNEFSFSGTSMKIIPGLTYTFTDDGVNSSHPFTFALYNNGAKLPQNNDYISGGESEGSMHNVLKGGGQQLTVQIPENYTGDFYYICYHHSSMNIKVFGD